MTSVTFEPMPPGLPAPAELRALAAHMRTLYDVQDLRAMVNRKDYDGAHQLVGALDAIDAIDEIAVGLEEAEAQAIVATQIGPDAP